MSAPKQRSGNTKTVKTASTMNPGDNAQRHKNKKGAQSTSSAQRDGARFAKGNNPGVSVGNSGNGHSNAALGGYPAKGGKSRAGKRNITAAP